MTAEGSEIWILFHPTVAGVVKHPASRRAVL
jgi:hypothetical protein